MADRGGRRGVGGSRVPYVRNARFEAERASRLLSARVGRQVRVSGVIAVICEHLTVSRQPSHGVVVTSAAGLRDVLESAPRLLTARDVAEVYELARRSTTWTEAARHP